MLEYSDGTTIISADTLSADLFKGYVSAAVITDISDCYVVKELVALGLNIRRTDVTYEDTKKEATDIFCSPTAEAVIAVGGVVASDCAKLVAEKANTPLFIIPMGFSSSCFVPYVFLPNSVCMFTPSAAHKTILCRNYLRLQLREEITAGLGTLSSFFITMCDSAYNDFIFEREARATETLAYLRDSLTKALKLTAPTNQNVDLLMELLTDCGGYISSLDADNLAQKLARLLSITKNQGTYSDYCFAASYSLYALYYGYSPSHSLLLPPDRAYSAHRLYTLIPEMELPLVPVPKHDIERRSFITDDCLVEIKGAIENFPQLARAYRRLSGSFGYSLKERISSDELLSLLPLAAEVGEGWSLLKQIYTMGELFISDNAS